MSDTVPGLDRRRAAIRDDLADARLKGQIEAAQFTVGKPHVVAAMPSAPMRRAARHDAPLDTEALTGETVLVFDEREGWAWVQRMRDSYVGYMPAEALRTEGMPPTHRICARATWIYAAPDIKSQTIGWLSLNALLEAKPSESERFLTCGRGFVIAAHVAAAEVRETDFVAVAEQLLGTPYLWGGRTALGVDCSGLVQLALEAAGSDCPRDSDMQCAELGAPVIHAPGSFGRGDLVFWRGHVGIMLDADRLLHANAHHMCVAIEPLAQAAARISAHGPVTAVRRLSSFSVQIGGAGE